MHEEKDHRMNIVLCTNSKYVMPSLTCIVSLLENNKAPIDFFILYSYLQQNEIDHMKNIVQKYGKSNSLQVIKIDDSYFADSPAPGRSKEAYFRLLISDVLPKNLERCLYLDSDMLVKGNINGLYNELFEDKAFVVCQDMGEFLSFHKERHEVLKIPHQYEYFNSGVLLFNLTYLRNFFNTKLFFEYINQNSEKLKFLDQDVLNALFYGKVKFSHSNTYDYMEILMNPLLSNDNMKKAIIVHFLQKPWKFTYNGVNADEWWNYAKKLYPVKYIVFKVVNFIYRKLLSILLIFVSVQTLKKIKA